MKRPFRTTHEGGTAPTGGTLPIMSLVLSVVLAAGASAAAAEEQAARSAANPCASGGAAVAALPAAGASTDNAHGAAGHGLQPVDSGTIVYDSNQRICWLADANLAANPVIRAQLGVAGINPDGTMDYATAREWIDALNHFDGGRGFLAHDNWQLPVNPRFDPSCSSSNNGGFGASCTGSALGNLYQVGLGRSFPDSVVPHFTDRVSPLRNLQPALYWTADTNSGGEVTFSFATDLSGSNTTKYNYLHVLPMVPGPIDSPPSGPGVVPYVKGRAAGKAVYDATTGFSWVLDANLAATHKFGLDGTTTITSSVNGTKLKVPLVDGDGAMLFATAVGTSGSPGWLAAMNRESYAGSDQWTLPHLDDLITLFDDLNLQPGGDSRLLSAAHVGPFQHLQPFFYWACEREQSGSSQSPCDPSLYPGSPNFQYSFDFDDGFEGTDLLSKQFYVMVYFPAPAP